MNGREWFCLVLVCITFLPVYAQGWRKITTVEEVCAAYPGKMQEMLEAFDLEHRGLTQVKMNYQSGDLVKACKALLDYYESSPSGAHLRRTLPEKTEETITLADTILKNVFVIQNVRGELPWTEDGHRDWHYKGPNNDREWAWLSNRHFQLRTVFNAYFDTGNPKYAEYIDQFLRDFIIASMPYPAVKSSTSVWRGLEVAARAKVWPSVFYGLQKSPYLSSATKLLLLSSLPDHAHYSRNFHNENNWLTMEISALATVAAEFPEYKKSGEWLDYAAKTMTQSMIDQVYPDGTQKEMSSHYHTVAARNFELFERICNRADYPLPDFFHETIRQMYGYTAKTVRPDGYGVMNNDGDRTFDSTLILNAAAKFNQPEWSYIVTNGEKGVKPVKEPSYFFPWAGQLISRSGFNPDAHWSFFDVGPWGSAHQHNDKLHLSVSAYGRDLLVDAGRFAYTGAVADKFRGYAKGSQGHNVILIDGKGQSPGQKLAEEPLPDDQWAIAEEYDYAWSSFDDFIDVNGEADHTRLVYYQRGEFWIVVDKITTDRPRRIDALWHWHPDNKVKIERQRVKTQNDHGNLQIIPLGGEPWDVQMVKGQEEPEIQGWYSEEYNKYEPNPTTIYSTRIEETSTFVWVLYPSEKPVAGMKAEIISYDQDEITVRIAEPGQDVREVTLLTSFRE